MLKRKAMAALFDSVRISLQVWEGVRMGENSYLLEISQHGS